MTGEVSGSPPGAVGTRQAAERLKHANTPKVSGNLTLGLAPVGLFNGLEDVLDATKDGSKEHGSSPE
jgi:hypothetical protein